MEKLLKTKEVAERYGIAKQTLISWRWERRGPEYLKIGKSVFYMQEQIEKFLNSHRVDPRGGDCHGD